MPTSTRLEYLTSLVDRLYPDRYQRRGTASATGSTTTIVDTDAFSSSALFPSGLVGKWIWVNTSDTTGKLAQITVHDRSTGTITLDRAVTTTTTSTSWWITFERNPQELFDAINQVLRNTHSPTLYPLSSQVLASNENDILGSNATTTKVSGSYAAETTIHFPTGPQSAKLTAGADGSYLQVNIDTHNLFGPGIEGRQYWASVLCATGAGAGTDVAELRIWDTTNSATIASAKTDVAVWVELAVQFTIPTNSAIQEARLLNTSSGDISYWQDFIFNDMEQSIFHTPTWLTWGEQVIGVLEMPQGSAGSYGDDDYNLLERRLKPVSWRPAWSNIRHGELNIEVDGPVDRRMYIYAMRPGTALTTDAATSYMEVDIVTENALYLLKHPDRAERFLRSLREGTMNANHSTPRLNAMAHFV